MPFVSQAQMKAAFSGGLGPEMKAKAKGWAAETPDIKSLPVYAGKKKRPVVPNLRKLTTS
jgi:hypothetical protein